MKMKVSKNTVLACPAPMCTPTKPSLGGADSWDGGGGDEDGVIIFAGGIDFQEASSYKSRPKLEKVTMTMHRVLLT